jgi:hypothetical protein
MKHTRCTLFLILLALGCQKEKIEIDNDLHDIEKSIAIARRACGVTALPWLSDMLTKAEEDRISKTHQGQYVGIISILKYQNTALFYTNFGLGSGGIAYYLFDCTGDRVYPTTADEGNIPAEASQRKNVIYSTIDI